MKRLIVVGELCVDLIVPLTGEIRFGQHEQLVPSTALTMGSSSAITACGAASLDVPTALVAVRGDDTFGAFLVAELQRRGVETDHIRTNVDVPTGASTHLTLPDGDRAILTAMGSIGETAPGDVTDALLRAGGHLHIGSWFLQRGLWEGGAALLRRARAAGLTTSVDGNFDPEETWDRGIRSLLSEVDVYFGNDQELCGIAQQHEPRAAARALLERMPQGATVVHKLGADGAVALRLDGDRLVETAASPPELTAPLIDTVGAGDTLAAGFLAGLLGGDSLAAALALGVACGTASTRGAGGVGAQPDLDLATTLAATVRVRTNGE